MNDALYPMCAHIIIETVPREHHMQIFKNQHHIHDYVLYMNVYAVKNIRQKQQNCCQYKVRYVTMYISD